MRRRVSIALATIGEPKVLIFDEPTTGLDPENRHQIWTFLNSIKQKGVTIIMSTHILEEADALCDRICIISGGEVKAIGTSSELKTKYGKGFKLSITLKNPSDTVKNMISSFVSRDIPNVELVDDSGGAMLFVIKLCDINLLKVLLRKLDHDEIDPNTRDSGLKQLLEIRRNLDNLSISNSSLEEVFISITS